MLSWEEEEIAALGDQIEALAQKIYEAKTLYDVHDLARALEIKYRHCKGCEAEMPIFRGACLQCGTFKN